MTMGRLLVSWRLTINNIKSSSTWTQYNNKLFDHCPDGALGRRMFVQKHLSRRHFTIPTFAKIQSSQVLPSQPKLQHSSDHPLWYLSTTSNRINSQNSNNNNNNYVMYESRRLMAGHNKWSKIRHKKGAKDASRAASFGKASKAIMAASRACNGDMSNLRLQSVIAHAKSIQLSKDRIEDAISKGTSKNNKNSDSLITLRFDAIIPFDKIKIACIITALTDNRNRTTQQIRAIITKRGGELLPTDKLSYLFVQVGMILVEYTDTTSTTPSNDTDDDDDDDDDDTDLDYEDRLLECALDAGAANVEPEEEQDDDSSANENNNKHQNFIVTTDEKDLWQVVKALQGDGYNVTQFEHRYILVDEEHGGVQLSTIEGREQLDELLETMDEHEDVTAVYHNAH